MLISCKNPCPVGRHVVPKLSQTLLIFCDQHHWYKVSNLYTVLSYNAGNVISCICSRCHVQILKSCIIRNLVPFSFHFLRLFALSRFWEGSQVTRFVTYPQNPHRELPSIRNLRAHARTEIRNLSRGGSWYQLPQPPLSEQKVLHPPRNLQGDFTASQHSSSNSSLSVWEIILQLRSRSSVLRELMHQTRFLIIICGACEMR